MGCHAELFRPPEMVALVERLAATAHKDARRARDPGRRHVAASAADVHRPRQPSGRARCRYLDDADAEPAIARNEREECPRSLMVRGDG